jgi:hypothetical protein
MYIVCTVFSLHLIYTTELCLLFLMLQCVFMISAVAAIEPSQRELTYALFDSVSKRLNYASRSKYLDQLIGPILFRWVACEVSLVSLVEVIFCSSAFRMSIIEFC